MKKRHHQHDTDQRTHRALLAVIACLVAVIVVWGRKPPAEGSRALQGTNSSLVLRRTLPTAPSDEGARLIPDANIAPIPLPNAIESSFRRPTTELSDELFVPLRMSGSATPTDDVFAPLPPFQPLLTQGESPIELRMHRVVEGDTLESIARRYYGNDQAAHDIYMLNRDRLSRPDLLPLGIQLQLPPGE